MCDILPANVEAHFEAEVTARIVERFQVLDGKAHQEVLLGRVQLAELVGNVNLFFNLEFGEYIVAAEFHVPRMLYAFFCKAYSNEAREKCQNSFHQ